MLGTALYYILCFLHYISDNFIMSKQDFQNVRNNLKDNTINMKPLCNHVIILDTIFKKFISPILAAKHKTHNTQRNTMTID